MTVPLSLHVGCAALLCLVIGNCMCIAGVGRVDHGLQRVWAVRTSKCINVVQQSALRVMSASAQPDVMATRELAPSVGLHPARMFEASLRLCTTDMFECHNRVYSLPVQPVWASACDTLGDVQHAFDQGVPVGKFWYWVSEGDQNGAGVELTLYSEQYCGGNPVEFNTSYQGRFSATEDPEKGDRGWLLQRSVDVMSVRATAVGTYTKDARQLGVKLVVFPRFDMDRDLHTVDEFTCVGDGYRDVGLGGDRHHKWPSDCASPIDRVYCLDPTPSGSNWVRWTIGQHMALISLTTGTSPSRLMALSQWEVRFPCDTPRHGLATLRAPTPAGLARSSAIVSV